MSPTQLDLRRTRSGGGPPLPLPGPGWGVAEALRALEEARPHLPALPARVELVSALSTVVVRAGEYAVKVYPPGTDAAHLHRLATALGSSATAHVPLWSPVVAADGVVTLTPWMAEAAPVSWGELGRLLRAFHLEHAEADVPGWTPLSRLPGQVAELSAGAATVLMQARARLLAALADVRSELGVGVIHGDVSPLNVLRSGRGPRLIDLDWVARAPREYDLAGAARRVRTGEIGRVDYRAFCEGYGFDVLDWPGLPVLDRIAELGGVAFRIWDCRRRGQDLDWLPAELGRWESVESSLVRC
jgi:hypothetical protein